MSQPLRTPNGLAIRAVAAAALYASKLNGQSSDETSVGAPQKKGQPDPQKLAPKKSER